MSSLNLTVACANCDKRVCFVIFVERIYDHERIIISLY
jgi:hypothetical protein